MPVSVQPVNTSVRPSFLETVLTNAGQVEMSDLKDRILEVTQNISQLKLRVNDYMKSKYIDFDPLLKKNKSFLDKASRTSEEINSLFTRIEVQTKCDLDNSTGELRSLHASLKDSSAILSITTELLKMDGALKDFDNACKDRRFRDAARSLQLFQELLDGASKETQLLNIYKSLGNEIKALFAKFCCDNVEKMDYFISWESTDISTNLVRQTLKIRASNPHEMQEVIQALHLLDELDPCMKKLRHFIMRSVLIPIINQEAIVKIIDGEMHSVMEVSLKINSEKPNYSLVLDNLTAVFEFLHGELDIPFENGDSFISLLGTDASEEFCNELIKKCLKETVPSSRVELENFTGVQKRTAAFNHYMVGIGFIQEENLSLTDYVKNFDSLCAAKACENYLGKAREIMKGDLQDMIEIGPQSPAVPLSETLDSTNVDAIIEHTDVTHDSFARIAIKPEAELNPNLFQFPRCYVSVSTLKILDLVNTILEEATRSPKQNGSPQFYLATAKSIFELYMSIVPNIHSKLLNTIPQQVALFHNNCMYLAHRLILLGFEVERTLRSVLKENVVVTFVDLVQGLRNLGTNAFLKHMQLQRKQMLDVIKESGLATLGENSQLSNDTERSLRQCLRQLELLQSVWENVLPTDVYCKSIGVLANAFIEELIVRVTSVEDIPANTAVQLTSLFKMVQERIPQLFKDTSDFMPYLKRWERFLELINILGASLRDIEERWADGKGPLAQEFTMEQVKQLVRALFQNTKRRAEVLAKIR